MPRTTLVMILSCLALVPGSQSTTKPRYTDTLADPGTYDYSALRGPATWGAKFDTCSEGQRQSPVKLEYSACIKAVMPQLNMQGHWQPRNFTMRNTWHSAEVAYLGDNEPVLSGGPLADDYLLSQVHFHWGGVGSEHLVDSEKYGMEVHLVHFKSEYGTVTNASLHLDGLAVVAIMLKATEGNNSDWDALVDGLSKIHHGDQSVTLPSHSMSWLEPLINSGPYYTYQGSLTTPPCTEVVTWLVLTETGNIGKAQIAEFQKLEGHEGGIENNVRDVQPLNGRQVFYCSGVSPLTSSFVLSLLLLSFTLFA